MLKIHKTMDTIADKKPSGMCIGSGGDKGIVDIVSSNFVKPTFYENC